MKKIILFLTILIVSTTFFGCSVDGREAINANNGLEEEKNISDEGWSNENYTLISVEGGDMSGERQAQVKVNIGFGDRQYWAYTNATGQLIKVEAEEIILQDSNKESILSNGRYYWDEADVAGTEIPDFDKGHVIADSLGGVSNAYNITPQNSVLNRHGQQAYMEKVIREAGGCTNFIAEITYMDTKTQIPSHYKYTYTLQGETIVDEFDNINPDTINKNTDNGAQENEEKEKKDISSIDLNGNGQISIKEAKLAGFAMPITKEEWIYQYMRDNDGDGMVGE